LSTDHARRRHIKNDAAFEQLRTVGAFLVSAKLENGKVRNIKVHSEKRAKTRTTFTWPGCL